MLHRAWWGYLTPKNLLTWRFLLPLIYKSVRSGETETVRAEGKAADADLVESLNQLGPQASALPTPEAACGGPRISKSPQSLLGSRPCSPNQHKVEECRSPYAASVMIVPKKGDPPGSPGSRLVVNYRPLNAATFASEFEWRVMPFDLKGAPSTFRAIMNSIFFDMLGQEVLIYMDDVLFFTDTFEEHLRLLNSASPPPSAQDVS
ncbi:hypothetical protein Esti_003525 [Eimeria stiedai]